MQTPNLREGDGKNWPDFYSILNSSPDIDTETLRLSINALYIKANQESDHRELSVRFYNQVLTQKVLPQCRRILLNEVSRQAYDQQWHLHRSGAENALSYQEFIHEISKDAGTERALLLSADEISILPSFSSPGEPAEIITEGHAKKPASAATSSVAASAGGIIENGEVIEGEEVIEAQRPVTAAPVSNSFVVAPNTNPVPSSKKGFPLIPALAGLLLLGVGGFAWNTSRSSDDIEADPQFASTIAIAKANETRKEQAKKEDEAQIEALAHPLIRLNTLALNADFETGRVAPWVVSNKQAYVENAPLRNAKSGNGIFTFWDTVSYDASMHQTITKLTPGKYTLRAWTQRTGGQERAEMSVTGYGGPTRIITLPAEPTWTLAIIRDVEVKIDRCTIGFSAKGPAHKHVQIDCVEFFRQ